jgi:hypothetical protein
MRRLLVTASVVPNSPILVTLMKEALSYSEKSVLTRATRRNVPEDVILHSHCHENLKSYTVIRNLLMNKDQFKFQCRFQATNHMLINASHCDISTVCGYIAQ